MSNLSNQCFSTLKISTIQFKKIKTKKSTEDEAYEDQNPPAIQITCDLSIDFDKQSAILWSTTWNLIGAQLLTNSDDTCAKIWNAPDRTELSTFDTYIWPIVIFC